MGRFTKDPEIRYTQSGMAVANFTIAVDRSLSRDKREQAQYSGAPTADFITCKAFGNTAETIGRYFSKGKKIGITGHIQTGRYENKHGKTVFTTDIIVDRFDFCESANQQNGEYQQPYQPQYQQQYSQQYLQNYQPQNHQPVQYSQSQNYQQPPAQYQPPQPPPQQQMSMDDEIPSGFVEIDEDDIPF